MSGTQFKILKQCHQCGKMFEAQKVTTACCSHKCSSARYKMKKRLEKRNEVQIEMPPVFKPKTNAVNKELIKDKEFLTVREVAHLLNCSICSVYRYINSGTIKAVNLGQRITRIKRLDIEKLF
jgi:excisionase family DNA binding protein